MDDVSKVQVFNSLMACGMKLSLSLVVLSINIHVTCCVCPQLMPCFWMMRRRGMSV